MKQETMRAVVITQAGGPEVLEIREASRPQITSAGRVLVRVLAAGLNRADLLQRRGFYPAPAGYAPDIPGLEFAGEVAETTSAEWSVGQGVFGITGGGGQAEYVLANEDELAEIPANLSWAEAAAAPEVFITAHDALFTQARLTAGESVLVHAVGSGVGLAAAQLAKAAGATVYGTSRRPDKIARAGDYGLARGVAINADPQAFVAAVKEWTGGAGVNVLLDLVGGGYLAANLAALAQRGRMMLVGATGGARAEFDFGLVMRKRLTLIGTVLRSRPAAEKAAATRLFTQDVLPLLANGVARPVVDSIFPLNEVRAAHERLESNETFGKVVLDFGA
jgi:putative PIG3 family NAD(P)H quinone oxidoreductase